jgi:quinol monooxygenase YgiN
MADVSVGLLVRVEAKEGKEDEVAQFLESALPLAQDEPDTIAWFAIRLGPSTFGIFDAFPGDSGRQAHLNGPIAAALMEKAPDLLSADPVIEQVDVLASKLPG